MTGIPSAEPPRRILYVSGTASAHTGSPRALIDIISHLDRHLFCPYVLVPKLAQLSKELAPYRPRIFACSSIGLTKFNLHQFLKSVNDFMMFYRQHKIALVHLNAIGWRDSCLISARLLGIPIVLHLHNAYPERDIIGNFNLFLSTKIIVVSKFMKKSFKNHDFLLRKATVIHNGVDTSLFYPSEVIPDDLYFSNLKPFVIGFVGQLSRRKGLETLVKSSPEIVRKYPNTLFLIVGGDAVGEEGLTARIKEEAERLSVLNNCRFLGVRKDIPGIMNAIDLLVVPSITEPFGKVITEAMACRKCVVASAVGGIPEIITKRENGWLVPPKDVSSLRDAILALMADDQLRNSLAASAYDTVLRKFDSAFVNRQLHELYLDLLSQK